MRDAFLRAFDAVRTAAQVSQIVEMLERGRIEEAIDALRLEPEFFGPLHEAMRASQIEGGAIALATVKVRDPYDGSRFILGFDGRHIRAEQWVGDKSSKLIAEIIEDQRDMARAVIRDGLEAGRAPRNVALEMVGRVNRATGKREGGFIGLTSQQAVWVQKAEEQLRGLDRGYLKRAARDKRFDGTVQKAIAAGKPLAEADIRRIVTRYKDRLLKARADLIAENETLTAMRAGQMEGIRQLVDSGKVRSDQVEREWSDTGDMRTRHDHRVMRGQKVRGVDVPFTFPDGTQAMFPGDVSLGSPARNTIRCRCIQHIRIKSDLMRG